jgi:carboxymethylenebutenolidase
MYHFGGQDKSITPADVAAVRAAYPDAPLYTYDGAGHGFNCELRDSYNPQAAALARSRTVEFLNRYVNGGAAEKSPGASDT